MRTLFWIATVCLILVCGHQLIGRPAASVHESHTPQVATTDRAVPNIDVHARLRSILTSHPDEELRNEFFPKFMDGEIYTTWNTQANAMFQLVRAEDLLASGVQALKELTPVLFVNPEILRPGNERMAQLVIYHEFVHYLQWRDRQMPEETFIFRPVSEMSQETLLNWCKQKWYAEVDAYLEECEFAEAFGMRASLKFCKGANRAQRIKDIHEMLVRQDPMNRDCSAAWRKITAVK